MTQYRAIQRLKHEVLLKHFHLRNLVAHVYLISQ